MAHKTILATLSVVKPGADQEGEGGGGLVGPGRFLWPRGFLASYSAPHVFGGTYRICSRALGPSVLIKYDKLCSTSAQMRMRCHSCRMCSFVSYKLIISILRQFSLYLENVPTQFIYGRCHHTAIPALSHSVFQKPDIITYKI